MQKLPLEGLIVVDFAFLLAAPVACTLLGEFGATVIKAELPRTGDNIRGHEIFEDGRSSMWLVEGRNKKTVTLDLRTEKGQELARKLAAKADVVAFNFRPGRAEEWNLSAEDLLKINPELVILKVSAYGQTGPYREKGGFDRIASTFAGMTHVSGYPDRPPVRSGYAMIDYMTAYLGAFGVMTALYNRIANKSGGEIIDISLVESAFRATEGSLTHYSMTGHVRERTGNRSFHTVPAEDFETKDGQIVSIHAGAVSIWKRLVKAIGKPQLDEDPRFKDRAVRIQNQDALYDILGEWMKGLTAEEALKILTEAGVPADTTRSVADLAHDPHMREREAVMEVDEPGVGKILVPGVHPKLARHPGQVKFLGAKLGEYNQEIYGEFLGLSSKEIKELEREGVI